MKTVENAVESITLASRCLPVVFYLGLTAALGLYAVSFAKTLGGIFLEGDGDAELSWPGKIDASSLKIKVASALLLALIDRTMAGGKAAKYPG